MKGIFIMKKIISLILAFILCFAFGFCCFAAPGDASTTAAAPEAASPAQAPAAAAEPSTTAAPIDNAVVEEAFKQFEKLIDAESEARYVVANEAMFSLYSVMKESGVKDYVTLSTQMKKYAEDNGSELAPVFNDLFSVQIILKKFTVDGTFDINKVQKEIEGSNSLDLLLTLYTGAYIVRTTQAPSNAAESQTTMVENPKTGDSSVSTAAAFAVLAISTAAIAVCAKKKES